MEKISVTTSSFGEYDVKPLDMLKVKGFEIFLNPYRRKLKDKEIIEVASGAVGIIAGTEMLDRRVMAQLKSLKVISRCGVGLENVDLEVAKEFGIKVFNTPGGPTIAVAELTIAMMLNLLRKINIADSNLKKGKWEKEMGNLLSGKRIGIIGFGRIGKAVAKLLGPFGCVVKYSDPLLKESIENFEKIPLEKLIPWADILSIHVSKGEEIIGEKEIKLMKTGSWLLNMSRGNVINEKALFRAVDSGHLKGAALDVFEKEPYDGPLKQLNNVILTPHIGSYAKESRVEMEIDAVRNMLKGLGLK